MMLFNTTSVVTITVSFDISSSKEYSDVPKFEVIILIGYLCINRRVNLTVLDYLLFITV